MRKKKTILIFAVVAVVLAFFTCAFLTFSEGIKKEAKENQNIQEEEQKTISLEETIQEFAEIIYSYDTSQRNYYEGAAKFMTQEGYDRFVPLQDSTQEEEEAVQMSSRLQEINCYYKPVDNSRAEVIAEVWFTLSGTGDFRIRQLIKLEVVRDDGWKIDDCIVLDTMEE